MAVAVDSSALIAYIQGEKGRDGDFRHFAKYCGLKLA